ncbi:uncharacterized protein BDR25DRAFT_51495 [Lindgomyces ingoldianus]|uniref:Uncharacterized protein n=1 Tax=Lindgomyces ingoldianus TaxID=673940 RepID=A0ACB6QQ95_9PLEO|nr:uncharacterized protein BDR25DRAFT_51495 [Lindgomyces ingoldianus]KAF2469164.1 hypothetical protein BDR25DRAFT_51495 [Lindgomyces ingoldianus]
MVLSLTALVVVLAACPVVNGHTWVEQLRNINDQGKYVGEYGYPRGFVSKTDPGFTGDSNNFLNPPLQQQPPFINATNLLCHPSQRAQKQNDKYPRLQAVPGGFMALRYMENGHVTAPSPQVGKPEKGGTIFVYGTTQPSENEKIATVLQWTKDGSGGDKRGVLLGANDFDDGRCYETNDTPISKQRKTSDPNFALGQVSDGPGNYPLFCETNVALPKDTATGKTYTLYWVWQWPTSPGKVDVLPNGKDEYYTTCMDVDVVDTIKQDAANAKFALGPQQDAMSVAVKDFASRTAIMTDPIKGELGDVFNSKPTVSGGNPAASQPALQTSIAVPSNGTSINIPTLTQRPGAQPTQQPDGIVTVTVTQRITVTAPTAVETKVARAAHVRRHTGGVKFRGRFMRESI